MKKFNWISRSGRCSHKDVGHLEAAHSGWGLPSVGHMVLDQLEVGETTIDDDGDTWERVE